MIDAPGSWGEKDSFVGFWPFYLSEHLPAKIIKNYTENKFYLYRHLEITHESSSPTETMITLLRDSKDLATVYIPPDEKINPELSLFLSPPSPDGQAEIIHESSPTFSVTHFGLDSLRIKTHFTEPKFLVYTDSFNRGWKAYLNGKAIPIYRANIAFKGVFVPEGTNEIFLRYQPLGGIAPYFALLIFCWTFFFCLLARLYKDRLTQQDTDKFKTSWESCP